MTRFLLLLFCSNIAFCGCKNKHDTSSSPKHASKSFISFEITYSNGWTPGFTTLIDSNNIYFSPINSDSVHYGLLPDSIFQLVDSAALNIQNDTTIKSGELNCNDCTIVAIKVETGFDTIKYFKAGSIHPKLGKAVAILAAFNRSLFSKIIPSKLPFETRLDAVNGPTVISKSWPTQ
jgi:hypothetical protein